MAILNSFVNDIFERIATEASSMSLLSDLLFEFYVVYRTRRIFQEIHHLLARNPNISPTHPSWWTLQACHLRRNQVCYQGSSSSLFISQTPLLILLPLVLKLCQVIISSCAATLSYIFGNLCIYTCTFYFVNKFNGKVNGRFADLLSNYMRLWTSREIWSILVII